jgi:iron(III) transport system permease protein
MLLGASVRRPGTVLGWLTILLIVTVVACPVVVLAWSLADPSTDVWRELWRTRLPGMISETAILLIAVVAGTVVVGTALAWVVSNCEFPGRRIIGWLLVTPLAIPAYVGGFVWLDSLSGVVGAREVRSMWLCVSVLTLSLYPYVYLFARAAFADQGADTVAAARSLGTGSFGTFLHVSLPSARPAIAAGATLVAMEVLTDIGTVRLFNVSTLADGVMRVWFGTGDRNAATELAGALTGAAIFLVACERLLRRGGRTSRGAAEAAISRRRLSAPGSAAAVGSTLVVILVAVGVPVSRLVSWAITSVRNGTAVTVAGGVRHHLTSTLLVAGSAALVCIALSTLLALVVAHRGRLARAAGRLSTLGYAMPGPVVAVGAVVTLAAIDRWNLLPNGFVLVGSILGVVFALTTRFLAVGYQGVEASLDRVPPAAVESARTLGAGPLRRAFAIEIPAARFGIMAAAALLCVDLVKELPITLLLRPFGVDTLSVWVWQATSESLWEQAAVPSLVIVTVGMVAVGALLAAIERGAEVVS